MLGEGMNTLYVNEIIHLHSEQTISNTGNQKRGRCSRVLRSLVTGKMLTGHINIDGSSIYRKYPGAAVMDAMDLGNLPDQETPAPAEPEPASDQENDQESDRDNDQESDRDNDQENDRESDQDDAFPESTTLPPRFEDLTRLVAMGLESINTGEVFILADAIADPQGAIHMREFTREDLSPGSPNHADLMQAAKDLLVTIKKDSPANKEAERMHIRGIITIATKEAASRTCRLLRIDPRLWKGLIEQEINKYRKTLFNIGVPQAAEADLKRHYEFTVALDLEMASTRNVPLWLKNSLR
jgi:hypothetical protein